MQKNYSKLVENFSESNIPNLDAFVLSSLDLFKKEKIPKIKISYKRPLVIGSGNAIATGKIIFKDYDAIFADESSFKEKLMKIKAIDGVILISASGKKHAPLIAKEIIKYKKPITFITNSKESKTKKIIEKNKKNKIYFFPKQREPYTYNVSTYLGPIISKTREDPEKIKKFIKNKLSRKDFSKLKDYDKFYLVVPGKFSNIKRLFEIKFIELFGRKISRDIENIEYVKHATTVVPSKELFIIFGNEKVTFAKEKIIIPLPKKADYASLMAIGYFIIGKIQESKPPYFKKNIKTYIEKISKEFNQKINLIVE